MKPSISEMRENPRFVEEYGSYEGWVWPLKCAHKTHILRIEHPNLGPMYLRYVPEDFIVWSVGHGAEQTLRESYEFELVQRWLKAYKAEFVKKEEIEP